MLKSKVLFKKDFKFFKICISHFADKSCQHYARKFQNFEFKKNTTPLPKTDLLNSTRQF